MRKREIPEADSCSHGQLNQRFWYLQVAHSAVLGDLTAIHGDLVARVKGWAVHAVFVDLVGQIVTFGQAESHMGKKLRDARKKANASDLMTFSFLEQRFHQQSPRARTFGRRHYGDGTNLRQMHAVKMQSAAADNFTAIFGHYKVPHILAQLRQRARQQRAVPGVRADDCMNLLDVWQDGVTRAYHAPPAS